MAKQSWRALKHPDRQAIRLMIRHGQTTAQILRRYPHVAAGTVAAVRAILSRAKKFGKKITQGRTGST